MNLIEKFTTHLKEQGIKGRVVPIQHLPDLQADLESLHTQDLFDPTFYQERLTFFDFHPPEDLPAATSMLILAIPRPQTRVCFTLKEKTLSLILPPTYMGYQETKRAVTALVNELLSPAGFCAMPSKLPLKTLAVRSGLAEYGRNNITYVAGMGSFHQLVGFFSDLPCPVDSWREPRMMGRCEDCQNCTICCPTDAITEERFLIHAERCLAYFNERPKEHPFPTSISRKHHNALMGCMLCQKVCPENKPFRDWMEGEEHFTHHETELILKGLPEKRLPATTKAKLQRLELLDALDILPRNLGVFF